MKNKIDTLNEYIKVDKIGIVSLKPGFFPVDSDGNHIQESLENMIMRDELDTLETLEKKLTIEEILFLYDDIYSEVKHPTPSDNLQIIRSRLLNYMQQGTVFSYLLLGDKALSKTLLIKKELRNLFLKEKDNLNVKNIIHVPEQQEIISNLFVLFDMVI